MRRNWRSNLIIWYLWGYTGFWFGRVRQLHRCAVCHDPGYPQPWWNMVEASSSPLLFLKFKCFISCPGFILLCWAGVSHISTPSMVVLLRKTLFLVNCLGVPDDSQVQMSSLKTKVTLQSPWCWGKLDFLYYLFFPEMVWFLSFSCELSSTGGGYYRYYRGCWSVTPCDLNWFGILFYHHHSLPFSLVDDDLLGGRENPIKILQRTAENSHTVNLFVGYTAIREGENTLWVLQFWAKCGW